MESELKRSKSEQGGFVESETPPSAGHKEIDPKTVEAKCSEFRDKYGDRALELCLRAFTEALDGSDEKALLGAVLVRLREKPGEKTVAAELAASTEPERDKKDSLPNEIISIFREGVTTALPHEAPLSQEEVRTLNPEGKNFPDGVTLIKKGIDKAIFRVRKGRETFILAVARREISKKLVNREKGILKKLKGKDHFPQLAFADEETDGYFWLQDDEATELTAEIIKPILARDRIDLVTQLAEALRDLHALGIIHQEPSPDNLVISKKSGKPRLVIIDFSRAIVEGEKKGQGSELHGVVSSIIVSALVEHDATREAGILPERILFLGTDTKVSKQTDIQRGLSRTAYFMITGEPARNWDAARIREKLHLALLAAKADEAGINQPEVSRVILKAGEEEVWNRFRTVEEFLEHWKSCIRKSQDTPAKTEAPAAAPAVVEEEDPSQPPPFEQFVRRVPTRSKKKQDQGKCDVEIHLEAFRTIIESGIHNGYRFTHSLLQCVELLADPEVVIFRNAETGQELQDHEIQELFVPLQEGFERAHVLFWERVDQQRFVLAIAKNDRFFRLLPASACAVLFYKRDITAAETLDLLERLQQLNQPGFLSREWFRARFAKAKNPRPLGQHGAQALRDRLEFEIQESQRRDIKPTERQAHEAVVKRLVEYVTTVERDNPDALPVFSIIEGRIAQEIMQAFEDKMFEELEKISKGDFSLDEKQTHVGVVLERYLYGFSIFYTHHTNELTRKETYHLGSLHPLWEKILPYFIKHQDPDFLSIGITLALQNKRSYKWFEAMANGQFPFVLIALQSLLARFKAPFPDEAVSAVDALIDAAHRFFLKRKPPRRGEKREPLDPRFIPLIRRLQPLLIQVKINYVSQKHLRFADLDDTMQWCNEELRDAG